MPNDDLVPAFDPNVPPPAPEATDNSPKADDGDQTLVSQEPDSAYDATGEPDDTGSDS